METNNPSLPNTPSVERAYKHKCIALKKRLREIETENDAMRTRNERGQRYIQKMRLESAMLLQRLSVLTGMAEEQGAPGASGEQSGGGPHLNENGPASETGGNGTTGNEGAENQTNNANAYMDDDTEGSSEDHPPTPQERPLRVKRSRRSDVVSTDETQVAHEPNNDHTSSNTHQAGPSSLPHLAPVNDARHDTSTHQQQDHLTSSFRITNASGNSTPVPTSPHGPLVNNSYNNQVHPPVNHTVSPAPPNEVAPSDTHAVDADGVNNNSDPDIVKRE